MELYGPLVWDSASHTWRRSGGSTLESLADSVSLFSMFFREQEVEITRLRSLTVDIRAQLQHGLEG